MPPGSTQPSLKADHKGSTCSGCYNFIPVLMSLLSPLRSKRSSRYLFRDAGSDRQNRGQHKSFDEPQDANLPHHASCIDRGTSTAHETCKREGKHKRNRIVVFFLPGPNWSTQAAVCPRSNMQASWIFLALRNYVYTYICICTNLEHKMS